MIKILLVEDDELIAEENETILNNAGYAVILVRTGWNVIETLRAGNIDIILLDYNLPDIQGGEVIKQIREFSETPVIMLSEEADADIRAACLDAGADDFVLKPFELKEFEARIRSVLRRSKDYIFYRDLIIDMYHNRVVRNTTSIYLSNVETKILACLAKRAGSIVSPEYIVNRVWDFPLDDLHLLRVNMAHIRKKLGDGYIETLKGQGYRLP